MITTDSFNQHFFVEFYYNRDNRGGFIFEEKLPKEKLKLICEAYGLFDGCMDLVEEIYEAVLYGGGAYSTTINVDHPYFKTINFKLSVSPTSSYHPLKSVINDGKYDPLVLTLGADPLYKGYPNRFKAAIAHELLHAYENLKRHNNKAISLAQKVKNIGYNKNDTSIFYNENSIEKTISAVLYYLTDFERNAYVAQIKSELQLSDTVFNDISDAMKFVKSTVTYQNYEIVFSWANELCSVTDKETQAVIVYIVNSRSNNNFKTYNQFKKWLTRLAYKTERKFNNIIPKVAAESLKLDETFSENHDILLK